MNMKKWYKRMIKKIGLELLVHGKELAEYVNKQSYGEGKTKLIRFHMTDIITNKDCVIDIKICE